MNLIPSHPNKENHSYSFQNISHAITNHSCLHHPDKQARYRNKNNKLTFCHSCAIQEASRGNPVEQIHEDLGKSQKSMNWGVKIYEEYKRAQQQIQELIQVYNLKYQKVNEILTDMQIKDLLKFNKKIEENSRIFAELKADYSSHRTSISELKDLFGMRQHQSILLKLDKLALVLRKEIIIDSKTNSQEMSFTKRSSITSYPKSQASSKYQSPQTQQIKPVIKKHRNRLSFNPTQIDSGSVKASKEHFEDTPESIKSKISDNTIRVTNDMAVTMFQKIDVCESIDLKPLEESQSNIQDQERSESCTRSRYRYSRGENIDTDR